jgi:hypothetical protein
VHSQATVASALALREAGFGARRIATRMDLPVATVRDWLAGRLPKHSMCLDGTEEFAGTCRGCGQSDHRFDELPTAYVYLLGLYLGDGTISSHPRNVYKLRISLDIKYPAIISDCSAAIAEVAPSNAVGCVSYGTWVEVWSYSKAWPCVFPQHGPGVKHARPIVLTEWQRRLVARAPDGLVRGLIQSDGCRFQSTGRNWSWPRYGFDNASADIRAIFCDTGDQLGVRWTASGKRRIYVSRKADVELLDTFIGPKR